MQFVIVEGHRLSRSTIRILPGAAALLLTSAASAGTGVASAQVREGDGFISGQVVQSINNPAVNHVGGWGFGINTSDGISTLSHFYGNAAGGAGAIMRTEGTFDGYMQTSFESFWGLANSGAIGYSATATQVGGPSGLDGTWVDDNPIVVEEQLSPFSGTFWSFGSRVGITADGNPYWVGGLTATKGGSTQLRGLFYGAGATPVLLGGDAVTNLPDPLHMTSSVDFDFRFSALGTNYIAPVQMDGPNSSSTDDNAIVINDAGLIEGGTLVREDNTIPVSAGGIGGEAWDNFDFVGITEDGQYMITGDTNGDANTDEFIFKNGQMLYREGDLVDGVTLDGAMEAAYMNEDGDIAYIWDHAGGEALFINSNLMLSEGDEVDWNGDGLIDAGHTVTNFTGISSLALSDRDGSDVVNVYFTADINTPTGVLEGGFSLTFQIPGPGAIALLGVAGLLGRRRRRA